MKLRSVRVLAMVLGLNGALALAADAPKPAEATPEQKALMEAYAKMGELRSEHKQLEYFVGKWSAKTSMLTAPSAPPEVSEGKCETKAVFGGRSYETHFEGSYQGQPFVGRGFMGFDNLKGKFFNAWMDNMSTGIWISLGSYDAAGKAYTFRGEMDDPLKPGKSVPIRQLIRIVDQEHYVFEWYETRDGKEAKTMWIDYTRT